MYNKIQFDPEEKNVGLFNSLKSQHERLCRAMDDQKTLPLATAAVVMRIRRSKVSDALIRMYKRGMFGGDQPYVDDQLDVIVRDQRYAPLAALLSAADELSRRVDEAQQSLRRVIQRRVFIKNMLILQRTKMVHLHQLSLKIPIISISALI